MSILNHFFDYKPEVLALDEKAMELCQPYFRQMEEIRDFNQLKMLIIGKWRIWHYEKQEIRRRRYQIRSGAG